MREAIGGTWLMGLVLTFVVLFSAFIAVAINYTRAFRVKNEIINIIERDEGYIKEGKNTTKEKIEDYLKEIGYTTRNMNISCPDNIYGDGNPVANGNYCYKLIPTNNAKTEGYYKVTTFVIIDLPLMWQALAVPVSGETKLIHNIPEDASAASK